MSDDIRVSDGYVGRALVAFNALVDYCRKIEVDRDALRAALPRLLELSDSIGYYDGIGDDGQAAYARIERDELLVSLGCHPPESRRRTGRG